MQITHISAHQTAKVVGLVYFCLSLILIPLFFLLAFRHAGPKDWWLLLAPIVYGVVGYLGTVFVCFVYNLLAPRIGGIEFSLSGAATGNETTTSQQDPPA